MLDLLRKNRWVQILLRALRKNTWLRIRTVGVRFHVRRIEPVKPVRKYVITLTGSPLSMQAAERCIKSATKHGEADNLEIMPAIDKYQATDFLIRHGLTPGEYPALRDPRAGRGCFASHFKLWLCCVELGEPIMILEHDAVFRAPVPPLRFKHLINLGKLQISKSVYHLDSFSGKEIFYPYHYLIGAHCYAIKPEGAHRLVQAARREKSLPGADVFLCKEHVDILYYSPAPTELDVRCSSTASKTLKDGSVVREDEFWKTYNQQATTGESGD